MAGRTMEGIGASPGARLPLPPMGSIAVKLKWGVVKGFTLTGRGVVFDGPAGLVDGAVDGGLDFGGGCGRQGESCAPGREGKMQVAAQLM